MTKLFYLLVLSISVLLRDVTTTVIFHNKGTLSGWDAVNQDHNGVVKEVTNVVYKSTTAIKCTQTYDSSFKGRYHSEVVKANVYRRGDTAFYGFMFRLSRSWEFVDQKFNIAQFIADFGDSVCDDYVPTTMVWIKGTKLNARTNAGPVCPKTARTTTTFSNLAEVSAGVWHKVEMHANWQSDNTGYFKLWFDGVKVFERFHFATTLQDGRYYQFRVGLYANGWHDDGTIIGSQTVRSVWHDEIGAGTTFADADPDQWWTVEKYIL
ncbi:hypothetical protein R1flu_022874 [Riccia fluitans]|uniref:Uncharacterized protein n=1 Tax=Riccia fluitans TaxID=41844 RepID=A0ABD1XQF8_9MARC